MTTRVKVKLTSASAAPVVETTSDVDGEIPPHTLPGSRLRQRPRDAARGLYGPAIAGAPTTTRQAEILNSATIAAPTGSSGVVIGRDVMSQTSIAHDPPTAYSARPQVVSSPNVVLFGDVGSGKSSGTKCMYVLRPLLLRKRRAVVFDRKDQLGEGEYSRAVRAFGGEPIHFSLDGHGTRLNMLDPVITGAAGFAGQLELIRAVVQLARGVDGLSDWEDEAIRAALRGTLASFEEGRVPTLADVLPKLGAVGDVDAYRDMSPTALDELHHAGLSVRFALNSLLESYGALLDGETSKSVTLQSKLTSFDISQLPAQGAAVPVVMATGHMWLLGRLRGDRGWATNCVYEEGWHFADGPTARLARANTKLSRGLGLSNVFVFHKGTDIKAGSDAEAMIQEAQTVHIYRQSRPDDAAWAQRTFGFDPETVEQIVKLRTGFRFDKIGTQPEFLVEHIRSDWEVELTNTDDAYEAIAEA